MCHKIGHFSSLCYKKRDGYENHKRSLYSPKAHQLKIGSVYTRDSLCNQSDVESNDDSFCLQLHVKSQQAKTKFTTPQHLITSLEYVFKPHKKRTKFLRARIDTCANVNLMPISVYQLLYKDPDCTKLAPSNKVAVKTYTTEM